LAQAPAPSALDPKLETEAEALYTQGEGRMKVASYEDAINEFRTILKRYPDTTVRYKAQFRMADALAELKKEPEAIKILQTVVKEESPKWSPKALLQMGDIYASQQKYSDAFRAYRQAITDYPDSPTTDRAYFAIGSLHFKLGHFELAAVELEKVGTAYASRKPELQRVSPGQPLQIRITEPNMVASANTTISATIAAKSGDKETVNLKPDVVGGERFRAAIPTQLGTAKPSDGVLQLHGSDAVLLTYKVRYVGGAAADKTTTMPIASSARLVVRDSQGEEVRGVVVSDTMTVEIDDADRDLSDNKDTITAQATTKRKDSEKLTLTETADHSGIFQANVKTTKAAPAADSGAIETNADFAEGSATQYDDSATISYADEQSLAPGAAGPRKVTTTISLFAATKGEVTPVEAQLTKADLDIQSSLYQGRSLSEIAATYRDLGQDAKATLTFRKAAEKFQEIMIKYPNAPQVEDALYGLFQVYVGQDQYDSAIAVITQITQKFPQSSRASEALFELAALHVKREEYDRALGSYQNLVQRAKGTPLAEDAQYAIATTYLAMLKPRTGSFERASVTRETVTVAFEEFARNYPESERTPEAMWQLVRFRYEGKDYRGTVDAARRMVTLYPDHVLTGRVLLLQGQAQYRLSDIPGAKETFTSIIANYGDEADQAQRLLNELEKRNAPKAPVTVRATDSSGNE
jgi:TolA-binding protein